MSFTVAPATGSIMSAVPPAKAGVGSALNDTTREVGGALGIAILGSASNAIYRAAVGVALSLIAAVVVAIGFNRQAERAAAASDDETAPAATPTPVA